MGRRTLGVATVRELIDSVDGGFFWGTLLGLFAGALISWRFARTLERFRDAVRHAVHHWQRAIDFWSHARDNIGALIVGGLGMLALVAALGALAWMRATG